jgi:hypothetical protein
MLLSGGAQDKIIAHKMRLIPKQLMVKVFRVPGGAEDKIIEKNERAI